MESKVFKIVFSALLGVSALFSLLFMLSVIDEGLLINWCYFLLGVATVSAIAFSIMNMVKNPKKAKSALIGVAGLIIISIIGYMAATNEEIRDFSGELLADGDTTQLSEGGLIATYVLLVGAIIAIIYAEVSKVLK